MTIDMDGLPAASDTLVQFNGEFPVDEAVIEALPDGFELLSAESYGRSAWTVTGKLFTRQRDGAEKSFFLKTAYGASGGVMLKGEFESAKEIYRLMPGFIPEPFGHGTYRTKDPITYFYLSEFVDMDIETAPDPAELAGKLAELHKKSQSPAGKFGFHVVTCDGKMPHTVDWEDSWAIFFAKLLQGVCNLDLKTNGPWPELERATEQILTQVIPRLLGHLTHDGKPIKPCILHGDLWEPNLGIKIKDGSLVMYDVGSYYGHNEMDLGPWKAGFCSHLRSDIYTQQYLSHYPPAEPIDQFNDRNRLYGLKGLMNYSAGHPGSIVRQIAYNNMCYLCEKYAPTDGIDAYDPQQDVAVTGVQLTPDFTKSDSSAVEKSEGDSAGGIAPVTQGTAPEA